VQFPGREAVPLRTGDMIELPSPGDVLVTGIVRDRPQGREGLSFEYVQTNKLNNHIGLIRQVPAQQKPYFTPCSIFCRHSK
jgi:hypothetical protein